jgi:hypothetical protein
VNAQDPRGPVRERMQEELLRGTLVVETRRAVGR